MHYYCADYEPMPPSKTHHIVWNLLLADKQISLTPELLDEEKIGHIVAILPNAHQFTTLNTLIPNCPYTVLEYGEKHEPIIDKQQFDRCGNHIDDMAKQRESHRNVLLFCNNGYQRSIPFVVHYLTTHHADEFPSVEKALTNILPQVDRENAMALLPDMVARISGLLN